jgi:hypothetical protein
VTLPIPPALLVNHAAQMHLIPATDALDARVRTLRPGQLVSLHGYLVDVRGPGDFRWITSLTRTDTGDGACEILWVETLSVD